MTAITTTTTPVNPELRSLGWVGWNPTRDAPVWPKGGGRPRIYNTREVAAVYTGAGAAKEVFVRV